MPIVGQQTSPFKNTLRFIHRTPVIEMASDISTSSYDLSERDDQLSLSSEEEVQAVESPKKKRMKKLPARYCDGGDDHTESDKLEIELKGSKFASI